MGRQGTERRRRALLRAAERAIRKRYMELDLGLADIAEEVGASPRQVQRVFRELADTDFKTALLRVRMERARWLLSRERNRLTMPAVAERVGYRGAAGLRAAFWRYYGCPPSAVESRPTEYLGTLEEPEIAPPIEWE
jgi:two-component system, response regulator YesN